MLSPKREMQRLYTRAMIASIRPSDQEFWDACDVVGAVAAALCLPRCRLLPAAAAEAERPAAREPYGIGLEGFAYPYPVHLLPLVNDGEQVRMAYMDVAPAQPNGRTVVLLHGRNFPSSYWAPVIKTLNEAGYRVVVPDQIGSENPRSRRGTCTSTRWRATHGHAARSSRK